MLSKYKNINIKMRHINKFNEGKDDKKSLQESMEEFYEEYESSYIDGNCHGVIKKLIDHLQKDGLMKKEKWKV